MNKSIFMALIGLLFFVFPAYAHHPAADIVDAEIYANIDEMVSDTPHADMVFDDMGEGGVTTTISGSLRSVEQLIDDGLLYEVSELDGDVYVTIEFEQNNNAVLTIFQTQE